MVQFNNVYVGQRVFLKIHDRFCPAKVRFKGHVLQKDGNWIGLELKYPLGNTDGMYRGQRYFNAQDDYGIFVTSDLLYFSRPLRGKQEDFACYDNWDDEFLMSAKKEDKLLSSFIGEEYCRRNKRLNKKVDTEHATERCSKYKSACSCCCHNNPTTSPHFQRRTPTPPRHNCLMSGADNRYASIDDLRNRIHSACLYANSTPKDMSRWMWRDRVDPPVSIPHCHMPKEAVLDQIQRGWRGVAMPRVKNVYNLRDSFHDQRWWNDVSL